MCIIKRRSFHHCVQFFSQVYPTFFIPYSLKYRRKKYLLFYFPLFYIVFFLIICIVKNRKDIKLKDDSLNQKMYELFIDILYTSTSLFYFFCIFFLEPHQHKVYIFKLMDKTPELVRNIEK